MQAAVAYNRSDNRVSDNKRGASTITQQVAKNLFLWPAQSYLRKAVEAYFTLLIEAFWSKRRILEVYLNIAQFGSNIFGVQAAAQHFFGKSALELSTKESALLASVLPSPVRHRVETPSHQVRSRQVMVMVQMKSLRDDFTRLMKESGLG
jgi:monofunctional biosynthetic peptidoglycan transglycosylase